jgi:hypothetical protein
MCEIGNEFSTKHEQQQYIIDLSTPETLERDFYAWLKGPTITSSPEEQDVVVQVVPKLEPLQPEQQQQQQQLPSISYLGEFIGNNNHSSSITTMYTTTPTTLYSYTLLNDDTLMSDGESPAPSSSASSVGGCGSSSISTGSPSDGGWNLHHSHMIIGVDQKSNGSNISSNENYSDIDEKVEKVAGRIKMATRFANTVNGRSSGKSLLKQLINKKQKKHF